MQKELGTQRSLPNILETAYSAIKQPSFVVVDPEPISQGSSDPKPEAKKHQFLYQNQKKMKKKYKKQMLKLKKAQ